MNTLLPQPAQITSAAGVCRITDKLHIRTNAVQNGALGEAVERTMAAMELRTGLPLRRALAASGGAAREEASVLDLQLTDTADNRPRLGDDESYTLTCTPGQGIRIQAANVFGAMHGLTTLQQLVVSTPDGFAVPAGVITDRPRFPWRGLMLDVSRHYMPLSVLYRMADGMAEVKLNVLHLHLTDDQGFRIESKRFPLLTQKGSDGLFYTQAEMRAFIDYCALRGIRVVPEFDMPGHVTSWLTGMPQLASVDRQYGIARTFGIWDAALDPTQESTYQFLGQFLDEMTALFPDEYIHLGGDESNGKDWQANPRIAAYMRQHNIASTDQLQVLFSSRVLELVKQRHRQMVGWDEILQPNTPKDAVIQSWRGAESLAVAARQGNRGILSAPYYLDAMKTAERMYLDDPLPAASAHLTTQQESLILGGELTMWAEQITDETIDSRVWPRAAALAERFWSPREVRDVDDLYRRLEPESIRLESCGLTHISGPSVGLRRVAGSEAAAAQLKLLTAALTPVSFSDRYDQQHTDHWTPMGNVVDYTRPDPPLRHHMQLLVREATGSDAPAREAALNELASTFRGWIAAEATLQPLEAQQPLLRGVARRRRELASLAHAGLDAVDALRSGHAPPDGWSKQAEALVKQAKKPGEIVEIAVLPSLSQLFQAAAARH